MVLTFFKHQIRLIIKCELSTIHFKNYALTDPNTMNDITEYNRMSAAVSYAILMVNFYRLSD